MHELHCYDYVNHAYQPVREAVLANPQELFHKATSTSDHAQLHVELGALKLGAEIAIEIKKIHEEAETLERPKTVIDFEWRAERGSALFPIMKASLVIYPLTPTETQLELNGVYDPPLGVVGEAVDAVALHRLAEASVASFVRDIAGHLRRTLSSETASA